MPRVSLICIVSVNILEFELYNFETMSERSSKRVYTSGSQKRKRKMLRELESDQKHSKKMTYFRPSAR